MTPLAPHVETRRRHERVLDARVCVLSGCRFLRTTHDRASGDLVRTCGAGVFRAQLPAAALLAEVERNPNPVPGHGAEDNPFLLRLLMAPECLRPECGSAELSYTERVLVIDPEELQAELFS